MNKNIVIAGFLLLASCKLNAQTDTIARRIILIGDAGELTTNGRHPVVEAIRKNITLDSKTTVLYLGDNIYPNGLPDNVGKDYYKYKAILDSQLSVADNTPAKVIMIPGNHDWRNGQRDGYEAIIREQLYVTFLLKNNVTFVPEDGCPGPVLKDLGNDVLLILFDSQWWIHQYDKPEIESDCQCKSKDELTTQIKDIVEKNPKKLIIIGCHHPFRSNGPHGGYFTLKQHIFPFTDISKKLYVPLPLIGSIYPLTRSVFGSPQDLKHPNYVDMINRITEAVKSSKNVIFVAGHEHNLELIREGDYNYVISGGGCKTNRASTGRKSEFITESMGFSVLEVSTNKNVTLDFYTVSDSLRNAYHGNLLNYSSSNVKDTLTTDIIMAVNLPDSVTQPATKLFLPIHGLQKFFMGQNYRIEWSTPVKMKTFDIDKERGGFQVAGIGGGTQTKTLLLKNPKDSLFKEWVLRKVEKTSIVLPDPFRNYLTPGVMKDLVTASHPYGALVIPGLANSIGVVVPQPQLFFVEDDPRLRGYKNDFSGKVCMLEDGFKTYRGKNTLSTSKIFNEMLKDNDHRPAQSAVLDARLLDMLIGDFDRHFDQWKWYKRDTGKGEQYYPIPRDRDEAFFYPDGKLPHLLSGRFIPILKGFRNDFKNIEWLSYTAKDFDRIFLTDLDEGEWKKSIEELQKKVTDSVIRSSVKNLPPEIYALDGENMIKKLISRRNLLSKDGMRYYRFISNKINIIGSNQKEYFKVSNHGAGLQVRVYERGRGNDTSFIMYDRIFDPSLTKEVRLYGLGDDDVFEIEENASSRIKFRIIGGNGNDTFVMKGKVENLLYDRTSDLNVIKDSSRSKNRFTLDPPTGAKDVLGFAYNSTHYPLLKAGYNTDDGYIIGAGFSKQTHGFRNTPYASDQQLHFLYSFRNAYQLLYRGEFNHITRNLDVVINVRYASPSLRNYFGPGNKTKVDPGKPDDFYRVRFKDFEMEALFRHRYFERLHAAIGPYYYSYEGRFKDNSNNILSHPEQVGLDSRDVFSKKKYLGLKANASFDNRNSALFPTRGILWKNELLALAGVESGSRPYTKISTDMTIYASQREPAKVIAIFRMGFGHIFGKNYEYFQALDIGANSNLQGFKKNRYTGKSNTYVGLEMRYQLFEIRSVSLPGTLGLTGFLNAGRVGLKDFRQRNWHGAFGGGIYYMPFNLFFISATAGFAGKEKIYNISIGSRINLTF